MPATALPTRPRFTLLAAAALLACVLLALGADAVVARALRRSMESATEAANETVTRLFINQNWAAIRERLLNERALAAPRDNPDLPTVDRLIRSLVAGTDVVKVKIISPAGRTLYSSDAPQIGEDRPHHAGIRMAAQGLVASELTHRGQFSAFGGDLLDRDLVSSYVPVRGAAGVEAIVEIYADRTVALQRLDRTTAQLRLAIAGLLLLGLGLVSAVMWRQARTLAQRADAQLQAAETALAGLDPSAVGRIQSSDFMQSVSHDLGASSGDLLARCQALAARGGFSAEQRQLIEQLMVDAHAMLGHVRRVTELTQIGSGRLELKSDPFDLGAIVRSLDRGSETNSASRAQIHVAEEVDRLYRGDGRRLHEVLQILRDNATAPGLPAQVQVKVQPAGESVQFDIIGTTLPREPESFEIPSSDTRQNSMLDLMIAQGLVQLMGGLITIRPLPGDATWYSFQLALPMATGTAALEARRPG